MAEPKVRFKRDDGSSYPAWKEYSISNLFTKINNKNKDGQNTNVITNSAEYGLIPQRDYFDKDIAVEGNTGNYTIIQTGDFVYNPRKSSYAPMGPFNCYRLEEDGIVSPLYSCLRPKGVLNPEYLLWYFQTDKWYGYVNDHGAQNGARHDRVGMTDKILMGIPVTAPCEGEQQKIADFLSSVDEVISTSEQEVANLETQKKAVMKKIFSQEVRFKRSDGSDFPEWKEKAIREFAQCIAGATPSTKVDDYWKDGTIPWMSSGEVNKGLVFDTDSKITQIGYDNTSTKMVPAETVVMALAGQGKTRGMVALTKIELCTNQSLCSIVSDSSVYSAYLYQYLITQYQNLRQVSSGDGTRGGLNLQLVEDYFVLIPCFEEQRLIADFLSDFDEAIAAAKKELELWKELKKGLLQQIFV